MLLVTSMPPMTIDQAQRFQARRLEGSVHSWHYPQECAGTEFQASVDAGIAMLKDEAVPFALLHDFRFVHYSKMDLSLPFLEWGRDIRRSCRIERVAFVVDPARVGWFGLLTINGMLQLSPVQPARVFHTLEQAECWCAKSTDKRTVSRGA